MASTKGFHKKCNCIIALVKYTLVYAILFNSTI
nr:MAG TPA: hypothetical protein [Caudoviricetes sp.]